VFVAVDANLQLGLDCVAALSPRRSVVYGWAMTPRGAETGLSITAGRDGECPIEHVSFHPRPDVVPADPRQAVVSGFSMVFATPDNPRELTFNLMAGEVRVPADLRDPTIEGNLLKATSERDWRATFALLHAAADDPALAPMLGYLNRPFGAFGDWIGRLPLLRGRAENFARLAEVEALASGAGEVLVILRSATPLPTEAEVDATLVGWLRNDEGGPTEVSVLPMADSHAAWMPSALAFYARVNAAWLDRLEAVEVVVQARLREEERIWLRGVPATVTVPDLLDVTCRGPAPGTALPAGMDLARQIIARREAAFAPTLAALAAPVAEIGGSRRPDLALVLGADDPLAARLFYLTADEFERRCGTVLVMGEAAEEVAAALARRGRLRVLTGAEAAAELREAPSRPGIVAMDAASYAQAVAAGRPEEVFARPLDATDVARLLTLHAVAGCSPALSDSFARLLRLRRAAPGEARFTPVMRGWSSRQAAELVNDHLARLWTAGPPPTARRAEHALHV
jgi:hypothetical protein